MSNVIMAKMKQELWRYTIYMEHNGGSLDDDIKFVKNLDEARAKARDIVEGWKAEGIDITHARVSRANVFNGDENLDWYLVYFYDEIGRASCRERV